MSSLLDVRIHEAKIGVAMFSKPWSIHVPAGNSAHLYAFRKGEAVFAINGDEPQDIPSKSILVLPSGAGHTLRDSTSTDIAGETADLFTSLDEIDFNGGFKESKTVIIRASVPVSSNPLPKVIPVAILVRPDDVHLHQRLEQVINLIILEYSASEEVRLAVVNRLSEIIAIEILEYAFTEGNTIWETRLIDSHIRRAINAIHSRLNHRWTVATLAEQALLSRSAFASRFHKVIGESPLGYIYKIRMNRAIYEIQVGQLSFSEIAELVGYESVKAFSKAFRRMTGITLSQYRLNRSKVKLKKS